MPGVMFSKKKQDQVKFKTQYLAVNYQRMLTFPLFLWDTEQVSKLVVRNFTRKSYYFQAFVYMLWHHACNADSHKVTTKNSSSLLHCFQH